MIHGREAAEVRIGVSLPFSTSDAGGGEITWAHVRDFARHAEDLGLDSVWICDHLWSTTPDGAPEGILEGWTILSALAVSTTRVELGQLVMCAPFRNPALLAKMAVTADAVSGGRVTLGLGAGWYDAEFAAFGYPADRRVARLGEALEIIAPLLRGEAVTLAGRFHSAREARLLPPPERRIPILVAAEQQRMLRLTARHAQGWNTAWYSEPDRILRQRLDGMAAALEAEGRDPATLRRTVGIDIEEPFGDIARTLDAFAELGFDDAIVGLVPRDRRALDRLNRSLRLRQRP